MIYDVCIIGLGAMGSATSWSLARAGVSVLGLDQYPAAHEYGSSHGETRIIRSVYFEGDIYTPLVRAAYTAWKTIETEHNQTFFRQTGGLDLSLKQDGVFEAALIAAQNGGFEHDVIEGSAIEARFPALDLGGKARAVWAPDSGLLDSDQASAWMREEAIRLGATHKHNTAVNHWNKTRDGFTIHTDKGEHTAKKLVIAAGAWMGKLLPALNPILTPERQVLAWYEASGPEFDTMPIFQLETKEAERYYAFPPHKGAGLKFGLYHHRRERGAEHITPRGPDDEDQRVLQEGLDICLPGVSRTPQRTAECRFVLAPDDRFIIDTWPDDKDITVLSPCSGHGYKFAPAIGDIAADLALERKPSIDISAFSVGRVL